MTRRLLLLGVPLLLLAAVIFRAFTEDSGFRPQQVAAAQPPVVDVGAAPERAEPAVQRTDAAPATDAPTIPADARWVDVRVVSGGTLQPVPDAAVAWLDGTEWQRLTSLPQAEREAVRNDQERQSQLLGFHGRTDQQGLVRVHLGAASTIVFARLGARFGSVTCESNAAPPVEGYRIELHDDQTLVVQVLDSRGSPAANVPVEVALYAADGRYLRPWSRGWLPNTGPDGTTRLRHVQDCHWDDGSEPPGSGAQWRVRTKVPGYADPGTGFEPRAVPAEPLVLLLPPSGSVEARVTFRGQQVPASSMCVNVTGLPEDETNNTAWQQQPDADGRFRFPFLPLGGRWIALARPSGTGVISREFDGPTALEPKVQLEVPMPEEQVILVGRCVDEHGQPVADTSFTVHFSASFGVGGTWLRTGTDGRFLWFAGTARKDGMRLERARFQLARQHEVLIAASLPPRTLTPGVNDFGDVALRAGALVVSGRVVIADAGTHPMVQMQVERREARAGGDGEWQSCEDLTTSHFTDGRFEVHGETTPVLHRLRFPGHDHLPVAPVEFQPGARDLEIQIVRGNDLTATVLLPSDVPEGIEAELHPEGARWPVADDPEHQRYRVQPWHQDGERHRLQWQALPPSSYTLAFLTRGVREPLLAIEGVKVPGPPDERLREIDLRGHVAVLTLHIVDRDGRPFDEPGGTAMAFVQPQDPAGDWSGFRGRIAGLRIPAPPRPIDVLVVKNGLQPKLVQGARGEVEVRLDPWPELQVGLTGLPPLPEGAELCAWLMATEPRTAAQFLLRNESGGRSEFFRAPGSLATVADGKAALPIGEGVHRLFLVLRTAGRRVMLKDFQPFEVVAGSVPLEIHVSAEEIRQAIAQLQSEKK